MEQTATALLVIGWKLVLALVAGSSILTTLGVFLLTRFTHVFDAYYGERAKLRAQFQNLDKLVEQTKTLTATVETIKARISDEVWDRQMRWNLKRDLYIRLLEAGGELRSATTQHQGLEQLRRTRDLSDSHYRSELERERQRTSDALGEAVLKLPRAVDVAPLVVSPQAYRVLTQLVHSNREIDFSSPARVSKWRRTL